MTDSLNKSIPRRHDLDALRAFAMFLGIALHGSLSFVEFPWPVQDSRQHDLFGLFFFAVHGFRMPMFFFVSGYFTMMLWQKRGLKSLIWHRYRRIFLPCMLGLVTILPTLEWVSKKAIEASFENAGQEGSRSEPASGPIVSVRKGELEGLRRQLVEGADPNAQDPDFGVTLLAWAAMHGDVDATQLLIKHGADVNGRNKDGSTPLHGAAFLGRPEVVDTLMLNGADVNARNIRDESSFDVTAVELGMTRFLAGLLRIPFEDEETVREGREDCRELLRPLTKDNSTVNKSSGGQVTRKNPGGIVAAYYAWITSKKLSLRWNFAGNDDSFHLIFTPVFDHLWFLWFLCWLVLLFAIVVRLAESGRWKSMPPWLLLSPARFVWLLPLTMIPQCFMGHLIPTFGPDTSMGLLPQPHLLVYYAIFFGFGAMYFTCPDPGGHLGRWWWLSFLLAVLIALPMGLTALDNRPVTAWAHGAQTIYAWAMTFGLIGLFRVLLKRENRTMRYLSDSSYWMYLAHVPLIIAAQAVVRDWPLPALIKFLLVCLVVTGFLLLTYQTLVRYTWLGRLLNGPRTRPKHAA